MPMTWSVPQTRPSAVRRSRGFAWTLLLGIGSAALAAVAAARPWGSATVPVAAAHRVVVAHGTDVAPQVLALAVVALASWGIVLVLRSRARRLMAAVGLAFSVLAVVSVAEAGHRIADVASRLAGDPASMTYSYSPWYAVTGVAAVVCSLCFMAAWWLSPGWPVIGNRYDAPGASATGSSAGDETDLWRALDDGHDPTA
jgi:hypothetical protein